MHRNGSDSGPPRKSPRLHRLTAIAFTLGATGLAVLGCASVLDIDQEYVLENSESSAGGTGDTGGASGGGRASGGSVAAGGRGSGGVAGTGGAFEDADAACTSSGDGCSASTKCCNGTCVAPAPLVGCGTTGCTPCPMPPDFGTMVCVAGECAVQCNVNHVLRGGQCEPEPTNTGGAGGASAGGGGVTGTGGTPAPTCDPKACTGCGAPGPFGCCKNNGECGCSWAPGGYCL